MPAYTAYGVCIDSHIALPELVCASAGTDPDIVIRAGRHRLPSSSDGTPEPPAPGEICLHYDGIITLLIKAGREVIVDPHPDADPRVLRLILLGPVLGMILHQRGFLVLHASAVQLGERAIAFIGEKGMGKSTTAAAFNASGHALVADDVVAVCPDTLLVHPAFPQLKLWPEAASHLHGPIHDLPRLSPDLEKLALSAARSFSAAPMPLHRVFSLSDGDREAVEPLPPQQAFMELIKHSYARTMLQATGSQASHFRQAVTVASSVPVRRLIRRRHLPALDQLIAAVVADAA